MSACSIPTQIHGSSNGFCQPWFELRWTMTSPFAHVVWPLSSESTTFPATTTRKSTVSVRCHPGGVSAGFGSNWMLTTLKPPGATDGGALHQCLVASSGGGAVYYERPVPIEAGSVIAPVFSMLYNTNFTHGT